MVIDGIVLDVYNVVKFKLGFVKGWTNGSKEGWTNGSKEELSAGARIRGA